MFLQSHLLWLSLQLQLKKNKLRQHHLNPCWWVKLLQSHLQVKHNHLNLWWEQALMTLSIWGQTYQCNSLYNQQEFNSLFNQEAVQLDMLIYQHLWNNKDQYQWVMQEAVLHNQFHLLKPQPSTNTSHKILRKCLIITQLDSMSFLTVRRNICHQLKLILRSIQILTLEIECMIITTKKRCFQEISNNKIWLKPSWWKL